LRAVGVDDKAAWVSPQQLKEAEATSMIKDTGISLERFKALKSTFTADAFCTEEERTRAASLLLVKNTRVPRYHFERSEGATTSKWCTPAQLEAEQLHQQQCTVLIASAGLAISRFRHLGVTGSRCTPLEKVQAGELLDARKPAPGDMYAVPLSCYMDAAFQDDDGYDEYGNNQQAAAKFPLWVTPEEHQQASDQWDGQSVLYDIDTQWGEMPWGGAYKDSLCYPPDGCGGYYGECYGY
jgi:hypothetical protein